MNSIRKLPRKFKEIIKAVLIPKPPKYLSENFRQISKKDLDRVESSLRKNYFLPDQAYLSSTVGQNDLQNQMFRRLDNFRNTIIPWLSNVKSLKGASVLEIGCGTGSSTITLAEQGANVTAIDLHEPSLAIARERCQIYGLNAEFVNVNATEVDKVFAGQHFDFIIYFATLEHMTHDERMISMKRTWNMLSKGDLWCVVESPNRMWFYDNHTSLLPFYHWLPDELAFKYSQFSPRQNFREQYRELNEETMLHFLRRGRGISYHEFELAMGNVDKLDIASSLSIFLRNQSAVKKIQWRLSTESRYESFLARVSPNIHRGFCQEYLDLIVRKN